MVKSLLKATALRGLTIMKNNKQIGPFRQSFLLSYPILRRLLMIFGFNWPSGFRKFTHARTHTHTHRALNKPYPCIPEKNLKTVLYENVWGSLTGTHYIFFFFSFFFFFVGCLVWVYFVRYECNVLCLGKSWLKRRLFLSAICARN